MRDRARNIVSKAYSKMGLLLRCKYAMTGVAASIKAISTRNTGIIGEKRELDLTGGRVAVVKSVSLRGWSIGRRVMRLNRNPATSMSMRKTMEGNVAARSIIVLLLCSLVNVNLKLKYYKYDKRRATGEEVEKT